LVSPKTDSALPTWHCVNARREKRHQELRLNRTKNLENKKEKKE
jgi:hypothetical protein